MRILLALWVSLFMILAGYGPLLAEDEPGIHKLALQVSDNDPKKMNDALNIAINVSQHYSELGEEVDIQIVAMNAGLHMLRLDTSPVAKRIQSFSTSVPNVTFHACGNTINSMTRSEEKEVPLPDFVEIAPAGVAALIDLDEAGYTVVKP